MPCSLNYIMTKFDFTIKYFPFSKILILTISGMKFNLLILRHVKTEKNVSNSVYFGLPQLDLLFEEKLFKGKRKRRFQYNHV